MLARLDVIDIVELVRSVFCDDVSAASSSSSVWLSTLIASYHLLCSSAICDLQSRSSFEKNATMKVKTAEKVESGTHLIRETSCEERREILAIQSSKTAKF